METKSRITQEMLEGTSTQDYIMPHKTRQMIIRLFSIPDVIAPSAAVILIIGALGALLPVDNTAKEGANGTGPKGT